MSDFAPGFDPFDPWDDDTPWLVQVDDEQLALTPPHDALDALATGLERWARSPHPHLQLSIDDGRPRTLTADELVRIVDACADTLTHFLRQGLLDDTALEVLGDATGTLHTIGEFDLERRFADDDPDVSERAHWVAALGRLTEDCELATVTRFRLRRDGSFTLRWRPSDHELLALGVAELRRLLTTDDPAIARLFPPPYGDGETDEEAERNASWNILARSELIENRIAALESVEALMGGAHATAEELSSLMRTINDARLVFATQLGIDDDGEFPRLSRIRRLHSVYELLGSLLYDAVRALRSTL